MNTATASLKRLTTLDWEVPAEIFDCLVERLAPLHPKKHAYGAILTLDMLFNPSEAKPGSDAAWFQADEACREWYERERTWIDRKRAEAFKEARVEARGSFAWNASAP